jgi:hypothetical protein
MSTEIQSSPGEAGAAAEAWKLATAGFKGAALPCDAASDDAAEAARVAASAEYAELHGGAYRVLLSAAGLISSAADEFASKDAEVARLLAAEGMAEGAAL